MAHAAARGTTYGASDALQSRWWPWVVVKKEGTVETQVVARSRSDEV